MIVPNALRPGQRVAVVAPSGPVPRDRFEAGLALLGDRYSLEYGEGLFARTRFLAGSDERRRDELIAALTDPGVCAILCARGGYGLTRLLGVLDPSLLRANAKPIVGFSDATALHAACLRAGLVSVHGPVVTQLASLADPAAAVSGLATLLESPAPPPSWSGLGCLVAGRATGPAVGGNLEVLTRLVGTPWMPPLDGAVLFLEEVTERPYRVDRQLTHLALAGALERVAAVVVGDLVQCDEADGSIRGDEVVAERLGRLPVPVLIAAPFGHGARNRPFVHGGAVSVDAAAGSVEFLTGAVALP